MRKLKVYDLETGDQLVHPDSSTRITLECPALEVLTDYRRQPPELIEGSAHARHAAEIMANEHQRMKLVVDHEETLRGIIGMEDMSEQNILMWAMENDIGPGDVLVSDLMHPRRFLLAMDFEELSRSTVEDVLHALQAQRQQYCLVVDRLGHRITGVLSFRDITRRVNEGLAFRFRKRRHQGQPHYADR